jgi:glycosyltransferase involved in cell wall biosynthesis
MRILIINWQDITNPLSGGAEVHLHNIFSRIARRGHEVTLFCSSYPGAQREQVLDGIRILRSGGRQLFNFHVPSAYLSRFRREQYDVVIDDMNKIPFFTPLYVNEPLVGIVHHLFGTSIFAETHPLVGSYVFLMERLALFCYRRCRTPFFAVSPSTEQEMRERGFRAEDLHIVHNCVDHEVHRPDPSRRSATPLIGYFGRLKKYKGVDQFISAVASVIKTHPGLRAVIVGQGDDRQRLERLAAELGVKDTVTFTGYVSEQRKVELLQEMWFDVTTSSKEGWGLTVLESNACGTPVIASDVPGLRDAVKNGTTGLLYKHGDVEDLAGKIRSLLDDGEQRARLTAGAVAWAGEFNWDDAASKTIDVLRKYADSKQGIGRQAMAPNA